MDILCVGFGGFIGACCRYLLTKILIQIVPSFPLGTLVSNIIAALLIGFIVGMERQAVNLSANTKVFLTTGLLGGLSTFSAFSMETISYFETGKYAFAGGNILLNVGLSLFCFIIGLSLAKVLLKEI